MTIAAFYDPLTRRHSPRFFLARGRVKPCEETPARADKLLAGLESVGIGTTRPEEFGLEPVRAVHTQRYLNFLESAHRLWTEQPGAGAEVIANVHPLTPYSSYPDSIIGQAGWHMADTACAMGEHTWDAALRSVNTALSAVQAVRRGVPVAYALCRPPGHHARADTAGGHCFLNNAAIAAQNLLIESKKVAMVDIDVHHGNGSQDIFYERSDVLTVSVHADPANYYPFYTGYKNETGRGNGEGLNQNLPLRLYSGDDAYLDAISRAGTIIEQFNPDALVVSLGLDASEHDPLQGLSVTTEGFARAGEIVRSWKMPMVCIQEGGYMSEVLGQNLAAFFGGH